MGEDGAGSLTFRKGGYGQSDRGWGKCDLFGIPEKVTICDLFGI